MALSISVTHTNYTVGDTLNVHVSGYGGQPVRISIGRVGGSVVHRGDFPQPLEAYPDTYTINIPADWLGSLTSSTFKVEAFQVALEEHDAVTISVSASAGMLSPVIGTVSLSPVQPESVPARFAGDYIASVTQARISANVQVHESNRGQTRVALSWPGGTVITRMYAGTAFTVTLDTPPVTENTAFTLLVSDSNGRQTSAVKTLAGVLPYTLPTVTVRELGRCDAEGTITEGGAYVRLNAEANVYTSLDGNSLKKLTAALDGGTETPLQSGVTAIIGGALDINGACTVVLTVQDQISGEIRRSFRLAGRLRDFVLKRGSGGSHLGIGCTPEAAAGVSTVQLPENGRLLIGGEDVLGALYALLGDVEATLATVVTTGGDE